MAPERRTDEGATTRTTEQIIAAVLAIAAAVHVALGLLRGFGIVGTEGIDIPAGPEALQTAAIQGSFWDALIWLIPAIAAATLALALASSSHHRGSDEAGPTGPMHLAAYIVGIVAVVFGALAVLVGFDVFNQGYTQVDGVLWGLASVVSALIAAAAHSAVPVAVADEDRLVHMVEQRVASRRDTGPAPGRPTTEPGNEPTP